MCYGKYRNAFFLNICVDMGSVISLYNSLCNYLMFLDNDPKGALKLRGYLIEY
jgi:hypothetical protein